MGLRRHSVSGPGLFFFAVGGILALSVVASLAFPKKGVKPVSAEEDPAMEKTTKPDVRSIILLTLFSPVAV
jgi:hypothetical protein